MLKMKQYKRTVKHAQGQYTQTVPNICNSIVFNNIKRFWDTQTWLVSAEMF